MIDPLAESNQIARTVVRSLSQCILALGLTCFAAPSNAAPVGMQDGAFQVCQAMVPPTGRNDVEKPMPMEERCTGGFHSLCASAISSFARAR